MVNEPTSDVQVPWLAASAALASQLADATWEPHVEALYAGGQFRARQPPREWPRRLRTGQSTSSFEVLSQRRASA